MRQRKFEVWPAPAGTLVPGTGRYVRMNTRLIQFDRSKPSLSFQDPISIFCAGPRPVPTLVVACIRCNLREHSGNTNQRVTQKG